LSILRLSTYQMMNSRLQFQIQQRKHDKLPPKDAIPFELESQQNG
jgi:hypothetical protein